MGMIRFLGGALNKVTNGRFSSAVEAVRYAPSIRKGFDGIFTGTNETFNRHQKLYRDAMRFMDENNSATEAFRKGIAELDEEIGTLSGLTGKNADELRGMTKKDFMTLVDSFDDAQDYTVRLGGREGKMTGATIKSKIRGNTKLGLNDIGDDEVFLDKLHSEIQNNAFKGSDKAYEQFQSSMDLFNQQYGRNPRMGKHLDEAIGIADGYRSRQIERITNSSRADITDVTDTSFSYKYKKVPVTDSSGAPVTDPTTGRPKMKRVRDGTDTIDGASEKMQVKEVVERHGDGDDIHSYFKRKQVQLHDDDGNLLKDSGGNPILGYNGDEGWTPIGKDEYDAFRTPGQLRNEKGRLIQKNRVIAPQAPGATEYTHTYNGEFINESSPLTPRQQRKAGAERARRIRREENKEVAAQIAKASVGESDGIGIGNLIKEHPYIAMGIAGGGAAILANANAERQGSY